MRFIVTPILSCCLLVSAAFGQAATSRPAQPWSARMADSIIARCPDPLTIEEGAKKWSYSTSFAVLAIARVGEVTGDPRYAEYAKGYVGKFVDHRGVITTPTYGAEHFKLDDVAPGRLMLLLHRATGETRYRAVADTLVAQLRRQPRTADGGFWHKQIYPHQMWLDGIYMACPVMAEYGRLTGDAAWHDEAAGQILTIAAHTRDAKSGLYFHGWDESRSQHWADKQTGLSACIWGRAVGWYVMGIVETLDAMPADHPRRAEVIQLLRQLADAIAAVQDPQTKLWYQVLDQGTRPGNYLESSASAMFAFALAKGARLGYLDEKHATVARDAYAGILARFIVTDPQTGLVSLTDTCKVAGLGGKDRRDGSFAYYMSEPRIANDPKGLAPFILASLEMERSDKPLPATRPVAAEARR